MMDSGSNSGSIQSSSGGDEEHDSRADGLAAAFLTNPSGLVGPIPIPKPKPNPPSPFDPFSNFFDPRQNSPLNLHPTNIQSQSLMTTPTPTTNTSVSVRNPRKRTRASRRAPTTVLTTDTSNFRAMVQEFTGIPAPPFTPAAPFQRPRLDVFGGSSTSTPPPYPLRPFPQKLSPAFLSPSSHFLLPKQNLPLSPNPNAMPSIFNLHPNINLGAQVAPEPNRNLELEELLSGNVSRDGGDWGSGSAPSHHQTLFQSMNEKDKYSTTTGSTKLINNFSGSSSSNVDFHGDRKGSENVTNRSDQGMIESWICSNSD